MKLTEKIMGMPAAFEFLDDVDANNIDQILEYFYSIDELFSPYKKRSDIYKLNAHLTTIEDTNPEVRKVLRLCEETKKATDGYFNIQVENHIDPSGIVKGYAISQASDILYKKGYKNFYIEIGGDAQIMGHKNAQKWKVGIENVVTGKMRVVHLSSRGIATSGLASHGLPMYDPLKQKIPTVFKSVTVIAPNAYDADRFSTALFAMGEKGKEFVEKLSDIEAFYVHADGTEHLSSSFHNYM